MSDIESCDEEKRNDLPSASHLLSASFGFFTEHFNTILLLALVPFLFSILSIFVPKIFPLTPALTILSYFINTFVPLALLVLLEKKTDSAKDIIKESLTLYVPFTFISILSVFVIAGGFILFIIPGIFFSVALGLSTVIFVVEKKYGEQALIRSWSYTRGYWWQITGKYFLLGLVLLGTWIGSLLVCGILYVILYRTGIHISFVIVYTLVSLGLSAFIATPLSIGFTYELFKTLKEVNPISDEVPRNARPVIISCLLLSVITIVIVATILIVRNKDMATHPVTSMLTSSVSLFASVSSSGF